MRILTLIHKDLSFIQKNYIKIGIDRKSRKDGCGCGPRGKRRYSSSPKNFGVQRSTIVVRSENRWSRMEWIGVDWIKIGVRLEYTRVRSEYDWSISGVRVE